MTWSAPVASADTLTGYTIQIKKTADATWNADSAPGPGSHSRDIQSLDNGDSYDIRVRARYGSKSSTWVTGSGTPNPVPGVPRNVAATPGDGSLALTWDAPASGAAPTGYDVEYRTLGADDWTDAGHSGTTRSQTIPGLANGVLYELRVRATSAGGGGPWAELQAGPSASSQTVVGFAKAEWEVTEDYDPHVTITLTLVPPLAAAGTASVVARTGDGAHTAGAPDSGNYTLPASVALPAGAHTATFDVVIPDNDVVEADKTLVMGLASPAAGQVWTAAAGRSGARLLIHDEDNVTVFFGPVHAFNLAEGSSTRLQMLLDSTTEFDFTVELFGTTDSNASTPDATPGLDYVIEGSPVIFRAGATTPEAAPRVRTLHDALTGEGDEVLLVRARKGSVPVGGRVQIGPDPASVTINTNANGVWGVTVAAGDARLDLTWNAPEGTVTRYHVHYTSSATVGRNAAVQTGASPSPAAGWVAVSRSGTATTQAISGLANGTEYRVRVSATVSSPTSTGFWAFARSTPLDPSVPVLTLSASPTTVVAGQSYTLTARLSQAVSGWVEPALNFAPGTAHSSRYTTTGSIRIPAGSTRATATLGTSATGTNPIGTFTASIGTIQKSSAVGAVQKGTPSSVEITIVAGAPSMS